MKRPKVRVGTLMLLVVIAALVAALVAERRRSARLLVEMEARQAEAQSMAARAMRVELMARVQVDRLARQAAKEAASLVAAEAFGLDPVVFSEIASQVATVDLGGVPSQEVEADLSAIAEGLPQPIELSDATAAYVVYRRDKKQSRERAVKSAQGDLRIESAVEAIEKAGAK